MRFVLTIRHFSHFLRPSPLLPPPGRACRQTRAQVCFSLDKFGDVFICVGSIPAWRLRLISGARYAGRFKGLDSGRVFVLATLCGRAAWCMVGASNVFELGGGLEWIPRVLSILYMNLDMLIIEMSIKGGRYSAARRGRAARWTAQEFTFLTNFPRVIERSGSVLIGFFYCGVNERRREFSMLAGFLYNSPICLGDEDVSIVRLCALVDLTSIELITLAASLTSLIWNEYILLSGITSF